MQNQGGEGKKRLLLQTTAKGNFTSMIRLLIISSSEAVTSSVITGGGLALCSKSKSTSKALFFGLFVAVTFQQEKSYIKSATESNISFFFLSVNSGVKHGKVTSPCIVQCLGSKFAFSICSILD